MQNIVKLEDPRSYLRIVISQIIKKIVEGFIWAQLGQLLIGILNLVYYL